MQKLNPIQNPMQKSESKFLPAMSRNTKLFGAISFLTDVSSEMIFPLLPFFLTGVLGAPAFVLGFMESIGEFTAGISRFAAGVYSDKIGKRKMPMLAGYLLSSISKGALFFAVIWQHVVALRFLDRLGKGIRNAPRDSLLAQSEKKENLGRAFGYLKMMDSAGATIGPLLASALLILFFAGDGIGQAYRNIFAIAFIPAIIAVALILFVKDKKDGIGDGHRFSFSSLLSVRNYKMFLLVIGIFSLGQFSVAFFLLKANPIVGLILIPIIYLAYNLFYTIFAVPAGYLSDKFGAKNAILTGFVLFTISIFLMAFYSAIWSAFLSLAILGVFMAIIETAPKVFITRTFDESKYGSAIGLYGAVAGIIALPSNLIAGILWEQNMFGTNASFVFAIATTLVALVLLKFMVSDNHSRNAGL